MSATETNGNETATVKAKRPRRTRRNFAAELRELEARVELTRRILGRVTEDGDASIAVKLVGIALETLDG